MESSIEALNQFFWTLTIFILFTCAVLFLSRALKKEEKGERLLMLGFTCVALGLAFNQFFRFFSTILISLENTLDLISILSFAIGLTLFFYIFDKTMKKTKFIPFIFNLILISLLLLFFNIDLNIHPRFFVYISYVFNAATFCSVLLWFSMKSGEGLKGVAVFLMLGAIIYLIGATLQSVFIVDVFSYSPIIIYAFMVTGAILFTSPMFLQWKGKAEFKRILIIGLVTCFTFVFVALYFLINLFLFYQVHYLFFLAIIVMICGTSIVVIYYLHNLYKIVDSSGTSTSKKEVGVETETKNRDILNMFSRRELNTKEEISLFSSLFKEKHMNEGSTLIRDDILKNETRKKIYDFIKENTAVYFYQIMQGLNLPTHSVIWHVNLLFSFDFICRLKIEEHYNHYIYFKKELSSQQVKKFYFLNNEKCKAILEYLENHSEGSTKTSLGKQLGMHPNTIKKYLIILEELQLVSKKKQAKKITYQATLP